MDLQMYGQHNIREDNASTLTLTEFLLAHLLRELLQARHDEPYHLILEHLPLFLVVLQYPCELMPPLCLLQQIEESSELHFCCGLSPTTGFVFVVSKRKFELIISWVGRERVSRTGGRGLKSFAQR